MQFPCFKISDACVEVRVFVGFCTVTAVGLILVTALAFATSPCDRSRILTIEQLYVRNNESWLNSQSQKVHAASPGDHSNRSDSDSCDSNRAEPADLEAKVVCYREWEKPYVANERDWEKLVDEKTPEVQRKFTPVGVSAFLFVHFGSYRNSPNAFSVVGLSSKALQVYGNPVFDCIWNPRYGGASAKGMATHYLPGLKAANQYTGTVIHCKFDADVGTDRMGGSLQIRAGMGSQDYTGLQDVQFVALTENPGDYDASLFEQPLKYDYMYCGSPLYGDINPQRVREWIAYHARIFGPRSHFLLYDAGGLHEEVRRVLSPWVKLGRVSILNYRQESRYDSHYHSQAVSVNDCLLQAKRLSQWAFFFDLDEYLYVPTHISLDKVMLELAKRGRKAQQITFDQRPMDPKHCIKRDSNDVERYQRQWGIEKLVFHRIQITEWGGWKDHKYAVQTRYILAAGTHDHEYSLVPEGMTKKETINYVSWEDKLHYYHYHNTLNVRDDLCQEFVDTPVNETRFNNVTHVYDYRMASLADAVRQYEVETIGPQPFIL